MSPSASSTSKPWRAALRSSPALPAEFWRLWSTASTGYLVPFEPDPVTGFPIHGDQFSRDLARRIAELMADPALCAQFGTAGRKRVEETFAWEAIAKQTAALYQSLINRPK